MRGRRGQLGRCALGATAALVAVALAAASVPAAAGQDPVQDVRRILQPVTEGAGQAEAVRALVALGTPAIPALFALVTGELALRDAPATEEAAPPADGSTPPLTPPRALARAATVAIDELALQALAGLPHRAVHAHVTSIASADASRDRRLAALRVFGRCGGADDLGLALALVATFDGPTLRSRTTRGTLVATLAELLHRNRGAWSVLESAGSDLTPTVREVVFDAVVAAERPDGARYVAARLGADPKRDERLCGALAALGARRPWLVAADARERVRRLLAAQDPRSRRAAAVALARLRDVESFEPLVARLADKDARVTAAALWALRELSGQHHLEAAADWTRFCEEQAAWWTEHSAALREDLRGEDEARALRAVRELATATLWRDAAAKLLGGELDELGDPAALAACAALERLESAAAIPALIDALTGSREPVVQAAWETLRTLTGADLPAEAHAWLGWVGS